jgi:hypothetical protein
MPPSRARDLCSVVKESLIGLADAPDDDRARFDSGVAPASRRSVLVQTSGRRRVSRHSRSSGCNSSPAPVGDALARTAPKISDGPDENQSSPPARPDGCIAPAVRKSLHLDSGDAWAAVLLYEAKRQRSPECARCLPDARVQR